MNRFALALLVSPFGLTVSAFGQRVAAGTITGCVTDTNGGALPGVSVAVAGAGTTVRVVSDVKGCFVLANVPSGTGVVEAELAGFKTERRENVAVKPGGEVRVDLSMCLSGVTEIDWVFLQSTYAQYLKSADAVLHVRITNTIPFRPDCDQSGWVHTATVLAVVKAPASLDRQSTITFSQEHWANERSPYPVNTELILSLRASSGRYARLTGPHGVFVVTGDTVHAKGPGFIGASYDGMKLDDFLAELRRVIG
jgi:hypothetical protein